MEKKGCCVWFTGLSGAGKSSIAALLADYLRTRGVRVTLLDGDALRAAAPTYPHLGFSHTERETHNRGVAQLARHVVEQGDIAVVALISPYRECRRECRAIVGETHFVEVYVSTPLEVCEARDPKGLYRRARAGELEQFTGISDPYEPPLTPDLTLTTTGGEPLDEVLVILAYLTAAVPVPVSSSP